MFYEGNGPIDDIVMLGLYTHHQVVPPHGQVYGGIKESWTKRISTYILTGAL